MSNLERLLGKFINEPDRVTLAQCRNLLEILGYEERKKAGSEIIFHRKGGMPLNVPTPKKGKYVKSVYVKRIVKLLELEDYIDGDQTNTAN